jgi:hypothetical protein
MVVYLVSGDGQKAGKTTLAEKLVGRRSVWSIAGSLRGELQRIYPAYNWYAKEQAYKDTQIVKEYKNGKYTIRDVLVEYGQEKSQKDPVYWVLKMIDPLRQLRCMPGSPVVAIDDVRKVAELELLKAAFPQAVHFHVACSKAIKEPIFDNEKLLNLADYVVTWELD